jgi:hypothetical protein
LSKIALALPVRYRVESQQFTLLHKVSHYGAIKTRKTKDQQRRERGLRSPALADGGYAAQNQVRGRGQATALARFHPFAQGSYGRIDELENESRTLAALRDTLLPKLLSGQLRISRGERLSTEANL